MAKARLSQRGRGRRRPSTWEISDSDTEGPTGAEADSEAAASAWDPAGERRAAAEALRLLRPEQALRRLVVHVDPAILEDAGADILMEALDSLGCEYHIDPQCPARSLRWSRVKPEPCFHSVSAPSSCHQQHYFLGLHSAALGWVFYLSDFK